jgi:hypothetical protein
MTIWGMRASLFLCLPLMSVLFTGCLLPMPAPHVTKRSPAMIEGHVRDAKTGAPIAGAKVELINHHAQARDYAVTDREPREGARALTRNDGSFHVSSQYNFHWVWMATPSFHFHAPMGTYWLGESTVSREGYESLSLDSQAKLRDVRLVPKP